MPESRVRTRSGKRLEVSRRCPVAARGGVGGAGRLVLALMLLALGSIAGCGEDTGLVDEIGMGESVSGSVVLRFGAIPEGDEIEQRRRFGILAAALEERLSVSVDYVPSADFAAALESFREGDLHFAWFDGLAGVRARNAVLGARAIAQGVEDSQYYSYWIANRKLGLEPGEAFPMNSRGLVFSFGPLDSTSGRLMPEYFIREETGEAPRDFYSEVGFSASHRETLALVDVGTSDLGVLDPIVYDKAPAAEKANTVVLWKTPSYPNYQITVRPDLDEVFRSGFTEGLQKVLLELPGDLCEQVFSRSGLVAASNEQFDGIEERARSAGPLH